MANKTLQLDFSRFLKVDLALSRSTIRNYVSKLRILLEYFDNIGKPIELATKEDIRCFLEIQREKYALNTYCCFLKSLRKLFRDYFGKPELANFRFPSIPYTPKILNFDKEDLATFYDSIEHPVVRIMFIAYCVTGLRRNDVVFLMKDELDTEHRMIIKNNGSRTKQKWITFYNEELAKLLHPYLEAREDNSERVFFVDHWKVFQKYWNKAKAKNRIRITPKDLRAWFCCELGELGVPDRYIDAFCGRVPRSVLARHYTDYSPKKLKAIYDKANLRVLA